jgi:RHS repeat-associated protein
VVNLLGKIDKKKGDKHMKKIKVTPNKKKRNGFGRKIMSIFLTTCLLLPILPTGELFAAALSYPTLANLAADIAGDPSLQQKGVTDLDTNSTFLQEFNKTKEPKTLLQIDLEEKLTYQEDQAKFDETYASERFIIKYKDDSQSSVQNEALRAKSLGSNSSAKIITTQRIENISSPNRLELQTESGNIAKGNTPNRTLPEATPLDLYLIKTDAPLTLQEFKTVYLDASLEAAIEYIQPDYEMVMAANDPSLPEQWGIEQSLTYTPEQRAPWQNLTPAEKTEILTEYFLSQQELTPEILALLHDGVTRVDANVIDAWPISQGEDVIVAVLDSGMDITHPDLSNNIIDGWDFVNNTPNAHDPSKIHEEWHATHIAGIIAAAKDNNLGIAGVAPAAKIMPLKIFENGTAYTSDIIAAIQYAESHGAKIANCSWGSSQNNPALEAAIATSNMLFVGAAGNRKANLDNYPTYPAALGLDNTIAVAALDQTGRLSAFSSYGPDSVDVAAPGENIISTLPGNTYGATGGTSMAAPFVAGTAALIWSQHPDWTAAEVKARILLSSDQVTGLADKISGGRKINAGYAVSGNAADNSTILRIFDLPRQDIAPQDQGEDYELYAENEVTSRTALPVARTGLATVTVGGKIYCIGGQTTLSSGYSNRVDIYDPETNTWTIGANIPTARSFFAAVAVGSKIYCIGGYNGSYLNTIQAYDTVANTWQTLSATNFTARKSLAAVEKDGKIYALAGFNGSHLTTVQEYTIATNTWANKGALQYARSDVFAFLDNGNIYVEGGWNASFPDLADYEETYNPASGTSQQTGYSSTRAIQSGKVFIRGYIFSGGGKEYGKYTGEIAKDNLSQYDKGYWMLSSMSAARANLGAAQVGEKIYFIGGENSGGVVNMVEEYDLGCVAKAPLPEELINFASVEASGKLYVLGGSNKQGASKAVYEYDPVTNQWSRKQDMTASRSNFYAVVLQGKIYIFSDNSLSVEAYDPQSNSWSSKSNLSSTRRGFAVAAFQNKIYISGGYVSATSAPLTTVETYDPGTNTWSPQTGMPVALRGHKMTVADDTLYVLGGYIASSASNQRVFALKANQVVWNEKQSATNALYSSQTSVVSVSGKMYTLDPPWNLQVYYPQDDTWAVLNNCFPFTSLHRAAVLQDKIYFFPANGTSYGEELLEYTPPGSSWAQKTGYRASGYMGIAVEGNKVYLAAGWGDHDLDKSMTTSAALMNVLDVYDASTNTWETKAPMAYARDRLGAAVINGKVYAVGGRHTYPAWNVCNYIEEYNPASNTWTTKNSSGFTARAELTVAAVNNKLYAIGGRGYYTTDIYNVVQEYNPATNTWSTKATMPTARYGAGAAVINGKIYVVGGYTSYGGAPVKKVEVFDPASGTNGTWTTVQDMPVATAVMGVTATDKLYVVGGASATGYPVKSVQVYNPQDNTWITKDGPNFNRMNLGAAIVNNELYAFYGGDGSFIFSNVESTPLDYMTGEFLHFGEEDVNPSGNFSRTYLDMEMAAPGFKIDINRTYNSMDTRTDSVLGKGWTFGFQGSLKPYNNSTTKYIARLPNGSGQIFTKSGTIYTAEDSRSTLAVSGTDTVLTTTDQYQYGFNSSGYLYWMKDRYGNRVDLTVNSAGRVTGITDQVGRTYTLVYNSSNLLTTVTDNTYGRTVQYTYASNQLATVTDPMGNITRYAYDGSGYLNKISDHNSNQLEAITYTTFSGETIPKVTKVVNTLGNTENYTYDSVYKSITTTDNNGRKSTTWYDAAFYPIKIQDADGRSTFITYFNNGGKHFGEEKSIVDRNGNKTEYERDAKGNVTKTIHPDGSYKTFTYDAKNNMTSETDEKGIKTFYVYDSNGIYHQKTASPLNGTDTYNGVDTNFAVTTYTYNTTHTAKGLLQSVTDPAGKVTTYTYDAKGYPATITKPGALTTQYTFNTIGWKTAEVSPKSVRTEYVYDKNGREVKKTVKGPTTAQDAITRTVYDVRGNITKVVSPNLYSASYDNTTTTFAYTYDHGLRFTYSVGGLLLTQKDAENNTVTYTYDVYGNALTETRPTGTIYVYTYDPMNRPLTKSYKASSSAAAVLLESYTYKVISGGRTQVETTRYFDTSSSATTILISDYADRPVLQYNEDNTTETITYYPNGLIKSATDARGSASYYAYDGLNRPSGRWTPLEANTYAYIGFTYDKADKLLTEKKGKSGVAQGVVPLDSACVITTYVYNTADQMSQKTDTSGAKTTYAYDLDGNITKEEIYTTLTEKNTTDYLYNYLGKIESKKNYLKSRDLYGQAQTDTLVPLTTSFTFDKNGNILTSKTPDNVITTFTYDNLNRLKQSSQPGLNETGQSAAIIQKISYNSEGKILTETDPLNRITTYTYNALGYNSRITDPLGNITLMDYDLQGRKIAEVLPENYLTSGVVSQMNRSEYAYDNRDNLLTKKYVYKDPNNVQQNVTIQKFTYDANKNITKKQDALGIAGNYGTTYTYDLANRLKTVLDPVSAQRNLSFTTSYAYDALDRKTSETNANNIPTVYTYNDANKLLTVTTAGTLIQTNTYDLAGNLLTSRDGNGATTIMTYNNLNKPRTLIEPGDTSIAANTTAITYDVLGNAKESLDSLGKSVLNTYDNQSRILSQSERKKTGSAYSEAITTSQRYDLAGNVRFEVDGNNKTVETTYSALNQKLSVIQKVTNEQNVLVTQTTTFTYDKNSNQRTLTDWRGNTTQHVYDAIDRLIRKIDANNVAYDLKTYNANNSEISSTDALGNSTQYQYDRNNRLLATIDPLTNRTEQTYDNVGNIATQTDPLNNVTTFQYDAFNNLVKVTDALLAETLYTYDPNGNCLSQTDGKGNVTVFTYNVRNLLKTKTKPDASQHSYTYQADGLLTQETQPGGTAVVYTHDVHGRLLNQTAGTDTVSYTYDNNHNRLTMQDQSGTTAYLWDEKNRTTRKTVQFTSGTAEIFNYSYDITTGVSTGYTAEKTVDPQGNTTTRVSDKVGRLATVTASNAAIGSQATHYEYYTDGSLKKITYPNNATANYQYNAAQQLIELINRQSSTAIIDSYVYTYDAAGNQKTKIDYKGTTAYTYDPLNRLQTVTEPDGRATLYTYDAAGNRETRTVTGGLTPSASLSPALGSQTNSYDHFNQLIQTTLGGSTLTYAYNGDGLRVKKDNGTQLTRYYYEGESLVLEKSGSAATWTLQGLTALAQIQSDGAIAYLMYNGHGDVTALLSAGGSILAQYDYDAFGEITSESGTTKSTLRYAGYQYDEETQNYYLRSRYYDPSIARFLTEDTYLGERQDPLSLNLYTYSRNNPILYVDPSGHQYEKQFDGLKGLTDSLTLTGFGVYNGLVSSLYGIYKTSTGKDSGVLYGFYENPIPVTEFFANGQDGIISKAVATALFRYVKELKQRIPKTDSSGDSGGGSSGSSSTTGGSTTGNATTTTPPKSTSEIKNTTPITAVSVSSVGNTAAYGYGGYRKQYGITLGYFDSADEAAAHFAIFSLFDSSEEGVEYFAYIYKVVLENGETYYTYSDIEKLGAHGGAPPNVEEMQKKGLIPYDVKASDVVAAIHTHGRYRPEFGDSDLKFSNEDMTWSNAHRTLYLANAAGELLKYDPRGYTDPYYNETHGQIFLIRDDLYKLWNYESGTGYQPIDYSYSVTVKPAVTYKRTTKEDRIPPKGHENPQRGN